MKKMPYLFISQDECDDAIVRTYRANEMDHYLHCTNKDRYMLMLLTLADGPFRVRIQTLLDETVIRLAEVEAIMVATHTQLPVVSEASLQRVLARETVQPS